MHKTHPTSATGEIARATYFWNTTGGLLLAFESVLLLMVLMRVTDVTTAGIFTIASANANLFLNLGKFGMRNFQVSDVDNVYGFATYVRSRIATITAMLLAGAVYVLISGVLVGYTADKYAAMLTALVLKSVDAAEDVCIGNCQQNGRLDVAAKAMACRLAATIIVFSCTIIIMRSLVMPFVIAALFTAVFFMGEIIWMKRTYGLPASHAPRATGTAIALLRECLPLFLAAFLLFFIGNAPKYAIDGLMDDTAQALYGFIAMPVFVVGLLASFVYNPIVSSLAQDWTNGETQRFARRFVIQVLTVVGLTVACDFGALLLGVPVLSWLYNTDLSPYLLDLIILITGGGFLALANLLTMGITIMRKQKRLLPAYAVVSLAAVIGSFGAVSSAGIDGASWIYLVIMAVLAAWFSVVFAVQVSHRSNTAGARPH